MQLKAPWRANNMRTDKKQSLQGVYQAGVKFAEANVKKNIDAGKMARVKELRRQTNNAGMEL